MRYGVVYGCYLWYNSCMAYIKLNKNREGKDYVYLVEGYRKDGKVKHRTLKSFGKLEDLQKDNPNILEELKQQAKDGLLHDNKIKTFDVTFDSSSQINDSLQNYSWLLLDNIYNSLDISSVISKYSKSRKFEYDINHVLKLLVYSRILNPCSKSKTVEYQKQLFGDWNIKQNDMDRSLDHLFKLKNDIQLSMHSSICSSTSRTGTLVFYDVTNYYFETDIDIVDDNDEIIEKGIRRRGPSKERRRKPIVQMGLFMDSNGIPISYELFPGNQTDPITYLPAIEQVKKQFGIERIVTVADKAMNSKGNVSETNENNDGWIFSQKVRGSRGVAKDIQNFALSESGWCYNNDLSFAMKSMIRERKLADGNKVKEKVLVTWSKKYAIREKIRRDGAIEYASKLTNAELFRMTSKKGGKRYLVQKVLDERTGEYVEMHPFIHLDLELAKEDEKYDGLNAIVTSEVEMSNEDILDNYRQLHKIEDCFRVTKTDLKTRPIYVWTKEHIEAHFLTCYIALTLMRMLQYKTDYEFSAGSIQEGLQSGVCNELGKGYWQINANNTLIEIHKKLRIEFTNKYEKYEKIKTYCKKVGFTTK